MYIVLVLHVEKSGNERRSVSRWPTWTGSMAFRDGKLFPGKGSDKHER
jgi:hypothetical protein